ncbi:MAG TPA: hypothetical protein VFS42_05420 [Burkholderiaceae bacterium]|nr:hypothetical protein [Burkholderiaceae bacterium]
MAEFLVRRNLQRVFAGAQASISASVLINRTPAWLQGQPSLAWLELPNTPMSAAMSSYPSPGGTKAFICSYSGACNSDSEIFVVAGGGHADYAGNEGLRFNALADVPVWALMRAPTSSVPGTIGPGSAYYSDGRPASRHTGWHTQFIKARNRAFLFGSYALWGNGNGAAANVDAFSIATNDYDAAGTYPNVPFIDNNPIGVAKHPVTEDVWLQSTGGTLVRWNQSSNTFTNFGSKSVYNIRTPYCIDPVRGRLVRFDASLGARFDLTSAAETAVTFTGLTAGIDRSCTVVWCPDRGADGTFLSFRWSDGAVFECNPVTFNVTQLSIGGVTPPAPGPTAGEAQLFGRFGYLPAIKTCFYIRSASDNVFVFKVA